MLSHIFTDLDAWKVNHELALRVYKITQTFPDRERFGIIDQLRRAATSVTANISEGWSRYHYPDRIRFYLNARGSNCEVQNFLFLARDLKYINGEDFTTLYEFAQKGLQVINGLIRALEKRRSS